MNERSKLLIMRECGMSKKTAEEFIWSDEKRGAQIMMLLGKDAVEIHGSEQDAKSLGLRRFYLSPGLRILSVPWSADGKRKYLVAGTIGCDPTRAEDAGKTEMYPTFKIDESWEDLEDIPDDYKIDVESIDKEVSAAEDVVMSHAEYKNCMNTLKREVTVEEGIKIQNREIEKQIAAVEEETTNEDEIIEKMGNNNMAFLCRVNHRAIDK